MEVKKVIEVTGRMGIFLYLEARFLWN